MNLRVDELDEQYSGDGEEGPEYSWFVEEEKEDEVIDETESEDDQEDEDIDETESEEDQEEEDCSWNGDSNEEL